MFYSANILLNFELYYIPDYLLTNIKGGGSLNSPPKLKYEKRSVTNSYQPK